MNIYNQIAQVLGAHPGATALVDFRSGREISARDLLARVEELAHALRPKLPPDKTVVAVCLPNGLDVIATVLALWKLDHAVMPLPHTFTDLERQNILQNGPAAALIQALNKSPDDAEWVAGLGFKRYRAERAPRFSIEKLAFVRFTSGTTAEARGVLISHEAISARAASFGCALGLKPGRSVLWHLDMSYHFTTSITAFLLNRCEIHLGQILLPGRFAEWLRHRQVDLFFSLPFFYDQWADSTADFPRGETRFYVTGQTLSEKTMRRFRDHLGVLIHRMYGVIEAGIPALHAADEDPRTVGKVAPAFEISLREGVIFVRGPGPFSGYLMGEGFEFVPNTEDWFDTGDLGEWNSLGELVITGRKKEMIIAPGLKFFPSEVERVVDGAPGVRASAVFLQGDELTAAYEGETAPEVVAAHVRQALENAKVPLRFVRVDQLPRTASGKILRRGQP